MSLPSPLDLVNLRAEKRQKLQRWRHRRSEAARKTVQMMDWFVECRICHDLISQGTEKFDGQNMFKAYLRYLMAIRRLRITGESKISDHYDIGTQSHEQDDD